MVRLPDGMRDRIKAAAEANNRSMNAEIVATLEKAYPITDDDFIALFMKVSEQHKATWDVIEPLIRKQQALPKNDERAAITDELKQLFEQSRELGDQMKEILANPPPNSPRTQSK